MAPGSHLPIELTSFVGRSREVAGVRQFLASSRLLSITGTAGCGKTRLALRVAGLISQRYADGVYWVELAQITDSQLLPKIVAKKLDVGESADRPLLDGIADALRGKKVLLVLDNCEHMISACAQLVETLSTVPGISMLATSREALGFPGENLYPLQPMAAPPANIHVDEASQYDAIQLFAERARAVVPAFKITAENYAVVASICRQLDGIPLAIELASVRVNVLTVEQIDARLGDLYKLLGEALHITSSHHRTLHAALDWSYDLLTRPEQAVLQRLSVFARGCTLAPVEAVCAGEDVDRLQLLDLLSILISKSLVVAQTIQPGEARYSLLETIRQYAHEKLVASGEEPLTRDRLLQCFLRLSEETLPKLSGPYQLLWLNWLESEYDNIRTCLAWSLETDRIEEGLRIAVAIYQFWTIRDYAAEGLEWLERLLARANGRISPVVHANSLAYAVFLAGFRGNTSAQIAFGQKAAALVNTLGSADKPALRWALVAQAYGARAAGDYQTQFDIGKQAIQLNRELGDRYQLAVTLSTNSFTAMSLGNFDEAHAMLDEALPLLREVGNPYRISMALNFSGDLARCEQDYPRAQTAYEESISILRKLDAPRDLASALQNLGHTCLHSGELKSARSLFNESLEIQLAQHNTPGVAECLIGFAAAAIHTGLSGAGVRLLTAAVGIGGQQIVSYWAATRMEYEHNLSLLHERLSDAEFRAEQMVGNALSLDQAIELARNPTITPTVGEAAENLTSREREVASLISKGLSNSEIAAELVISKRTIEKHIAHILMKLGVTNRAQIILWAIETGLQKPAQ